MKYKNKVVVVTGAGQGIGACIARNYAKEGAIVMLVDSDEEAGIENENHIIEQGFNAIFYNGDVCNEQDIIKIFQDIEKQYGRVDIVINNAAISDMSTLCDRPISQWRKIIDVNLTGPYIVSKYAIGLMNSKSSIINICSIKALASEPHTEPFSASKGGLLSLTHSLAVSLGPKIRVNAISPGWIDVSLWKKEKDRKFIHISEKLHKQHPIGRVGKPEDVAKACLFLTSEEASFITGSNIVVDGGMNIKMIYD